jgi:catechol 2,3-dioxygenase-like lactoylglutathione lyase family enzyme
MLRPFFHLAVLVLDLDRAVDRYSALLGQRFNEPSTLHLDTRSTGGYSEPVDLRVAYSREGPPYLELLEATGDGLFSSRNGRGFHHAGYWVPEGVDIAQLLASNGVKVDTEIVGSSGAVFARFTTPRALDGVRLELIDEGRRAGLERWFAGAEHPGHD